LTQFIDKFEKEQSYFKKAIVQEPDKTWPYESSDVAREMAYNEWLKDITDPTTEKPYLGKKKTIRLDDNNKEIEKIEDVEAHEEVISITRLKTEQEDEYLLTKTDIVGYNQFGDRKSFYIPYKEMYKETLFVYKTGLDEKTSKLKRVCYGPNGSLIHYTVKFTDTNVDKIWAKRAKPKIPLVVKNEATDEKRICPTLEMFKTKSVDYIINADYMTKEEKELKLKEEEMLRGEVLSTKRK
jgi:hypothetical protein